MAPSIISHFRPHRRVSSTPSSPQLAQEAHPIDNVHPAQSPKYSSTTADTPVNSSFLSRPPTLPPITRVVSHMGFEDPGKHEKAEVAQPTRILRRPPSNQAHSPLLTTNMPPFILPPIQRVTSRRESDSLKSPVPESGLEDFGEGGGRLSDPIVSRRSPNLDTKSTKAQASFVDCSVADIAPIFMGSADTRKLPQTPSNSSLATQSHDVAFLHPQPQNASSPTSSVSSFHKTASSTNLAIESSPASSRSAQGPSDKPSATSNRASRSRFNLLNPVSLLKRRRTSQVIEPTSEAPVMHSHARDMAVMELPANYDPRIKGKGVHNFDGPRPKRNFSTNDMTCIGNRVEVIESSSHHRRSSIPTLDPLAFEEGELMTTGQERAHTPVFVENFDEEDSDASLDQTASAVQRESLANSHFLARMSKHLSSNAPDGPPPFGHPKGPPRSTTTASTSTPLSKSAPGAQSTTTQRSPSPPRHPRTSSNTDNSTFRASIDQSTARSSLSDDTEATSPSQSPTTSMPHPQGRSLDPPLQSTSNLSHLPSTASRVSRFSFQLNSDQTIEQEKALEEKHKQKHSSEPPRRDSRFDDFEEEDIDYDDMIDDGGYEEDIPTMGEEETIAPLLSTTATKRLSSFTARDRSLVGDVIHTSPRNDWADSSLKLAKSGQENMNNLDQREDAEVFRTQPHPVQPLASADFGDMYFDDGMIDDISAAAGSSAFDESLLDSPTRPKESDVSVDGEESTPKVSAPGLSEVGESTWNPQLHDDDACTTSTTCQEQTPTKPRPELARKSLPNNEVQPNGTGLNAYHSALAEAASRAARDGKFSRHNSVLTASSVYSSTKSPPEPDILPPSMDDGRTPGTRQAFEDTGDDEDDVDQFIAEANADALASEDSDLYGQEFGFFRIPNSTGDGQLCSGGYFGQPDLLGISLRNREPNLTPITERSEYSTRNSIVGGTTPWGASSSGAWGPSSSVGNLVSPGLKDIAASMGLDDEEMTLGQLLKLRRETFGSRGGSGPQSAHVSSSSNDSSPASQYNPSPLAGRTPGFGTLYQSPEGYARRQSDGPELAQVQEAPEVSEGGIGLRDSPIGDNVSLNTARAILAKAKAQRQQRRVSAEILAQEYSDIIKSHNSSPVPGIAVPTKPTPPSSPTPRGLDETRRWETPLKQSTETAPRQPIWERGRGVTVTAETAPALSTPLPRDGASVESTESPTIPSPSTALLQRFANRSISERQSGSPSLVGDESSGESMVVGTNSVAYICENDSSGGEKWFLEKRRCKSNGELIVVAREPVEGGGL